MKTVHTKMSEELLLSLIVEFLAKNSFISNQEDIEKISVAWATNPFKVEYIVKEV